MTQHNKADDATNAAFQFECQLQDLEDAARAVADATDTTLAYDWKAEEEKYELGRSPLDPARGVLTAIGLTLFLLLAAGAGALLAKMLFNF